MRDRSVRQELFQWIALEAFVAIAAVSLLLDLLRTVRDVTPSLVSIALGMLLVGALLLRQSRAWLPLLLFFGAVLAWCAWARVGVLPLALNATAVLLLASPPIRRYALSRT
jgi:hypothetical protein